MSGPTSRAQAPLTFRLSVEQRKSIGAQFDPNAAERIANLMTGEDRRSFLASFGITEGTSGERRVGGAQESCHLMSHPDPRIQVLLEEMWLPVWRSLPPEALHDSRYHFPGRALALKERQSEKDG